MNKAWQTGAKTLPDTNGKSSLTFAGKITQAISDARKSGEFDPLKGDSRFSANLKGISLKDITSATNVPTLLPGAPFPDATFVDTLTLMGLTTIESRTFSYLEHQLLTNTADTVAEGSAKPLANLTFVRRDKVMSKVAVHTPVTAEQLLDDAQIQNIVNNRLAVMIRNKAVSQVLYGNGTPPNVQGIASHSGILTQAKGADSVADAISKGIDKLRTTNGAFDQLVNPSAIFINPSTLQPLRLERSDTHYVFGGPTNDGLRTFWGVPVIETVAVPAGQALIGDLTYVTPLTNAEMMFSVGHIGNQFIENEMTMLAEMFIAVQVDMPSAFLTVTGLS